jgi:hypothetical protein
MLYLLGKQDTNAKGIQATSDIVKFDGTQEPRTWLDDYPTGI